MSLTHCVQCTSVSTHHHGSARELEVQLIYPACFVLMYNVVESVRVHVHAVSRPSPKVQTCSFCSLTVKM